MNFRDLELQEEYNSISNDVYRDFFNYVLKYSKRYARVGGIFNSRNFAACADGLQEFIQNDGKIELVLLPSFNQEDADAIDKGIKKPNEVISEQWIKDFNEIKDKFVKDHTKALAWMLANNYLEIRLVIPTYPDGKVIPTNELEKVHIFKRKTGIFWAENYDAITFSGNIDFDDKMFGEYYYFRVYRSWDDSEKKFVDDDFEEFQRFWEGKKIEGIDFEIKTISLPKAIKENLIAVAPQSKSEINLDKSPKLRPYQEKAVRNWISNNKRGIFEMATGTGKTFTAIGGIKELQKTTEKLLVVIVCPFDNLERQWATELSKWELSCFITSRDPKWHQTVRDNIAILESSTHQEIKIIITSYITFHSEKFTDTINRCKVPILIIADEVHNAGSSKNQKGLIDTYSFRLGLSATLERYFDPEGTNVILKFFGDTVYTLDLQKAIENNFLVGYYYYPTYVDLTEEEYIEYKILTLKIARLWNANYVDKTPLEIVLHKRARIIRDAANKIVAFKNLVSKHNDMKYTLIYCSENQMDTVKNILNNVKPKPIINREITADNPKDPKKRIEILKDLAREKYFAIVANRVLDEGVDVPEAKNCIMLASTGNPKQFIQRRGRVLRKFSDTYPDGSKKEFATIYDILVMPKLSDYYTEEEIRIERAIVRSQILRQEMMANIAKNREECLTEIEKIKQKFAL